MYKGYNKNIIVEKVLLKEKAYLEKFILSSSDFSRCDVGIAPYDRHRKVMLRRVTIKAHSVGVDDYIDPKVRRSLSEFIFVRGLLLRGSEVSTR